MSSSCLSSFYPYCSISKHKYQAHLRPASHMDVAHGCFNQDLSKLKQECERIKGFAFE